MFVRSGDSWAQQAYLKARTPARRRFRYRPGAHRRHTGHRRVARGERRLGIGGDESNNQASGAGAVYVFVRQGTTWTQQAYIKASNTGTNDNFGAAVTLTGEGNWFSSESSGDLLAVGALGEGSRATGIDGDQADNSAPLAGAVYVFRRQGTTWTQDAYFKASNATSPTRSGQCALSRYLVWARRVRPVARRSQRRSSRQYCPRRRCSYAFDAQPASGSRMRTSRRATPRLATIRHRARSVW